MKLWKIRAAAKRWWHAHGLVRLSVCRAAAEAAVAAVKAENDDLRMQREMDEDFIPWLKGELNKFPCCCEPGAHDSTPPMWFPELVACIRHKAVDDAETPLRARISELESAKAEHERTCVCTPKEELR